MCSLLPVYLRPQVTATIYGGIQLKYVGILDEGMKKTKAVYYKRGKNVVAVKTL